MTQMFSCPPKPSDSLRVRVRFIGEIMKEKASLHIIRMWSANYNENKEEFLICHSILMTFTVYHIRNGIVSIMWSLHPSTEEKPFMKQGGLKWEKF